MLNSRLTELHPARRIRDSNALAGFVRGPPQCGISIRPISAQGHKRTLHHLTRSASLLKADMRELHLDNSGKCQNRALAAVYAITSSARAIASTTPRARALWQSVSPTSPARAGRGGIFCMVWVLLRRAGRALI
jgi:hypothetical protein